MLDQQIQVPGWRGGDGDASYLDKTLRHTAMELSLDESVAGSVVWRLWARAAAIAGIWWFFFAFIWLVSGGASDTASSSFDGYSRSSGGSGNGLILVAGVGAFIIFWLVFLLTRLQEPIGEWRVLLADRAAAKPDVYSQIAGRLRDRGLPIGYSTRRIRTGLGRDSVGDRVILQDGHYFAYISVFEYGSSLYLGWMMWRNRRGATLVGRFLADVVGGVLGRTDPIRLMLRTERPRAMREAVHSVCREGLHVAVEGLTVPESYGFPSGLPPIEDAEAAAAATPRSAPTPAAMPMPASLTEQPIPVPVPEPVVAAHPQQPQYQSWDTGQQQPAYDPYQQQGYAQPQYQSWDTGQQQTYGYQEPAAYPQQPAAPQQPDFFHRGDAQQVPPQSPYTDPQQWGQQ